MVKIKDFRIRVRTRGVCDSHNLTPETEKLVVQSDVRNGQVTLFVVGSTAGLTTIEFEPGLVKDLEELFQKLVPREKYYHHEKAWHDGNGFSHIRASLLKPSLTVPVVGGKMTLGTWQQIILVDFDNQPRHREVVVQIIGE